MRRRARCAGELKITHQEIAVRSGGPPQTASVKMIARIKAQLPGAANPQGLLPVVLELRKSDGWKVMRAEFDRRALPKGIGS